MSVPSPPADGYPFDQFDYALLPDVTPGDVCRTIVAQRGRVRHALPSRLLRSARLKFGWSGSPPRLEDAAMAQRRKRMTSRRRASTRGLQRAATAKRWRLAGVVAIFALAVTAMPFLYFNSRPPRASKPMTMADARASNAAVPIEARHRLSATRYLFRGSPAAREQAVECLATAALYEAGDDRRGQKAVMQVILNRVRKRGYPKTICGVVYQGAARSSGCQFSFTCDGSLKRRPVRRGWADARQAARSALKGKAFPDVGRATHYHADWIVPYWRDSLVKIAKVRSHLFYVRAR